MSKPSNDRPFQSAGGESLPENYVGGGPEPLSALLYLVSTPIGNAGDLSPRAQDVLARASVIACEDTRVTGPFLARFGISGKLLAYHDHNAERRRPAIIERLKKGESVALVSDAGTPLVSDPGYKLVQDCIEQDIPVTAVPGPSAVLTALALSGLPTDRFFFGAFLPPKSGARRKRLAEVAAIPGTLIFMEGPSRLAGCLADMSEMLGPRSAAVARELTKKFEEVRRGALPDLAAHYADAGPPRGEIMIVVGPPGDAPEASDADVDALLIKALKNGSVKDAAAEVAAATGMARKAVYARALEIKNK
ncbi:MAG: 16S rRNA (cytidine(1402)-2'-O)-methyltransferase [Rhodospirillaceae bacterium]